MVNARSYLARAARYAASIAARLLANRPPKKPTFASIGVTGCGSSNGIATNPEGVFGSGVAKLNARERTDVTAIRMNRAAGLYGWFQAASSPDRLSGLDPSQRRARIGGREAVGRTERVEHREEALCSGEAGRAFDER